MEHHLIAFILLNFNLNIIYIEMESYHRRKRLLEAKYGKVIAVAPPINADIGKSTIASHRQQTNS